LTEDLRAESFYLLGKLLVSVVISTFNKNVTITYFVTCNMLQNYVSSPGLLL